MSTRFVSQTVRRQSRPARGRTRGWPGPDILVLFLLVFLAIVCAALGGLGLAAI